MGGTAVSVRCARRYTKSGSICRAFLDQHAPKKSGSETAGEMDPKPASPAQMLFAERISQEKGIVIPDETKASAAAMSAWIETNRGTARQKRGRMTANEPPRSTAPKKRAGRRTGDGSVAAAPPIPARQNSGTDTPLRIPYGNKDDALKLGARYRSEGVVCPAWSESCCLRRTRVAITPRPRCGGPGGSPAIALSHEPTPVIVRMGWNL